jgi:hypothetical protein
MRATPLVEVADNVTDIRLNTPHTSLEVWDIHVLQEHLFTAFPVASPCLFELYCSSFLYLTTEIVRY